MTVSFGLMANPEVFRKALVYTRGYVGGAATSVRVEESFCLV